MVVARIAIARLAVCRADAVAELRDLQGSPIELRQRGNQPGNHTGFAHATRMSANHHNGHAAIFAGFVGFKNQKLDVTANNSFLTRWPTIKL